MKSAWSAAGGGFQFAAGGLVGSLQVNAAGDWSVRIGETEIGAVRSLSWKLEGDASTGVVKPTPADAYIQQPYVVVPFNLKTPADLRLTAFFRATEQGIDADYRLATVLEVDDVALEIAAQWPARAYRWQPNAAPTTFPGVSAGVLTHGGGRAALFVDVGEHGDFKPSETGATLGMFRQSLEKGVILVGRFALRQDAAPEQIQRDLQQWLEHPSASL